MTIYKGVLIMVSELVTNAKMVKEGKEYISRLLKKDEKVLGRKDVCPTSMPKNERQTQLPFKGEIAEAVSLGEN